MIRPMLSVTAVLALCAGPSVAQDMNFNRIASFMVAENTPDAEETSAEIISATEDGMTLVYSDSPGRRDRVHRHHRPRQSRRGRRDRHAGRRADLRRRPWHDRLCRGEHLGQLHRAFGHAARHRRGLAKRSWGPATSAGSPTAWPWRPTGPSWPWRSRTSATRTSGDGRVPQMPAGFVVIVPLSDGAMDCDGMIAADVTGLADIAPEDPEPEFVVDQRRERDRRHDAGKQPHGRSGRRWHGAEPFLRR
jgi:hypothetical protein